VSAEQLYIFALYVSQFPPDGVGVVSEDWYWVEMEQVSKVSSQPQRFFDKQSLDHSHSKQSEQNPRRLSTALDQIPEGGWGCRGYLYDSMLG
jgi:hypothetical protein